MRFVAFVQWKVPPHISLAAITWAFKDRKKLPGNLNDVSTWFDFDAHACRIIPDVLLKLIRVYFPRYVSVMLTVQLFRVL